MNILIIEDEEEISNSLKINLEAEYFIVDTASDGERGSFFARTNDYDLIILDNMLPKKEGLIVCKEIREMKKYTPIIILSANTELSTKIKLLNSGADDYITKPFSFEELLSRINVILRRPQEVICEILEVDDLFLNSKKHTVIRGGKNIKLTRKEFILLEYFMKNKDVVLSRGMIMEHVWEMDTDPFSNTIETHILNLRKKIESKGKQKIIHTIPCIGYKIST